MNQVILQTILWSYLIGAALIIPEEPNKPYLPPIVETILGPSGTRGGEKAL